MWVASVISFDESSFVLNAREASYLNWSAAGMAALLPRPLPVSMSAACSTQKPPTSSLVANDQPVENALLF
jgi:hypothetical protein